MLLLSSQSPLLVFEVYSSNSLVLRMALTLALTKGDDDSPSPGSEPALRAGTYYVQVAVYADDANIPPRWFKITCSEAVSECAEPIPCHIKEERPKFAK
jgi:hypothetical protein